MHEEHAAAPVQLFVDRIERRIGERLAAHLGRDAHADHSEFVQRAGHLRERRIDVRQRQRGEGLESLRIQAHHLGVGVVGRARADHGADFARDVRAAGRDREDLHADAGPSIASMRGAGIRGVRRLRAAPAHARVDLAAAERLDQVEIRPRKVVGVNVDAQCGSLGDFGRALHGRDHG